MSEPTRTLRLPMVERVLEANDEIAAVTRDELDLLAVTVDDPTDEDET